MEIFKELAGIEGRHELIDRLRMAWNLPINIVELGRERNHFILNPAGITELLHKGR